MIQKKKTNLSYSKKLNRIKSENVMPIGSLMQEIGQLREELKGIKKSRRQEISSQIKKVEKTNDNKENSRKKEFSHQICSYLSKEIRLKVEIAWGKICKGLSLTDEEKVKGQILEIIELFNSQSEVAQRQKEGFRKDLEETLIQREHERKEESEKYWIIAQNNKNLQNEVEQLKNNVCAILSEKQEKMDQIVLEYENQKEIIGQLKAELQEMTKTNLELQNLIEEWEKQCKILQEKCQLFDKTLIAKDHQIKMMQDDVRYLRIESEKFKSQKYQFEKLWEKSSVDLREFKRAFEEEVVKAQREKNKWMNQCELRRHESQQIQAIDSQKEVLVKQVQELRNKYSLKCKELSETKALLHEMQRKIISIEGDHFRMTNQLQKTQRENEYWETQMFKLRKQFDEYSGIENKMVREESGKKTKTEKMKALDSIHSLIKQFRSDDAI